MLKKSSVVFLLLTLLVSLYGCDSKDYKNAVSLYADGKYQEAEEIFIRLGDYENSSQMVLKCRYDSACRHIKNKNYQEAVTLLIDLGDYEDCRELLKDAQQQLMYQKYAALIDILQDEDWYFYGGAESRINTLHFTEKTAVIMQTDFNDKLLKKEDYIPDQKEFAFTINDSRICLVRDDEIALEIPYYMSGSALKLGEGEYYTLQQIDESLQGYWTSRYDRYVAGMHLEGEYNLLIDHGQISFENAAAAMNKPGRYYYYGPYRGSYTLDVGCFNTDMEHGFEWNFNIINGKPVIFHLSDPFQKIPASSFPGRNGYSF